MNKTKLISPAKINFDLKIKYYDENYEKHKISSKVVLLKIKDIIIHHYWFFQLNILVPYHLNHL